MGKVSFSVKEAIERLEQALKNTSKEEADDIREQLESFRNLEKEGIKEIHLDDGE